MRSVGLIAEGDIQGHPMALLPGHLAWEGGNTAEVKNILEGPVDAAMFQVRPGYTKKEVGKVGKLTKEKTGKKDEKTSAGNLMMTTR